MGVAELPRYTAARIAALVHEALRGSGALGVLPTPLEVVREAAGLDLVDTATLGEAVLGALWFERRTIYVDPSLPTHRRRFTEAHEIAHALCPWHRAVLLQDTTAELFGPTRDALEAEANAGAAMLLFQGAAFAELAADMPCTFESVRRLARAHGTSVHATLHHFVESVRRPLAMLAIGRFPAKDGTLPVWRHVSSSEFRACTGRLRPFPASGVRPGTPLRELVERARTGDVEPVHIRRGGSRIRMEAHYNRHSFLVLLSADNRRRR